jgi:hypothetical protein
LTVYATKILPEQNFSRRVSAYLFLGYFTFAQTEAWMLAPDIPELAIGASNQAGRANSRIAGL